MVLLLARTRPGGRSLSLCEFGRKGRKLLQEFLTAQAVVLPDEIDRLGHRDSSILRQHMLDVVAYVRELDGWAAANLQNLLANLRSQFKATHSFCLLGSSSIRASHRLPWTLGVTAWQIFVNQDQGQLILLIRTNLDRLPFFITASILIGQIGYCSALPQSCTIPSREKCGSNEPEFVLQLVRFMVYGVELEVRNPPRSWRRSRRQSLLEVGELAHRG